MFTRNAVRRAFLDILPMARWNARSFSVKATVSPRRKSSRIPETSASSSFCSCAVTFRAARRQVAISTYFRASRMSGMDGMFPSRKVPPPWRIGPSP